MGEGVLSGRVNKGRRVLRRAAAAYGVVYLAFYSARDVQTLTNQRGIGVRGKMNKRGEGAVSGRVKG